MYLVSSIERIMECSDGPVLYTRRNAALQTAEFTDDLDVLDTHIDWGLMEEHYWSNTDTDQDRRARRMAECVVHISVPWEAIDAVVVFNVSRQQQAAATLTTLNVTTPVHVERDWYF